MLLDRKATFWRSKENIGCQTYQVRGYNHTRGVKALNSSITAVVRLNDVFETYS